MEKTFEDNFKILEENFKIDEFEELKLNDIIQHNEQELIKLNRDVTKTFQKWIVNKIAKKENISINIKGETRSGKSLIGLKIAHSLLKNYSEKTFDTNYIICGNQKEFRLKLQNVEFGDVFQIDENAFNNVGHGSMSEMQQLRDIQNIIAKKNVHTIYITPKIFLNTGAKYGLAYYGKDNNNWLSRFLLFDLTSMLNPILLGFVKIDVGSLFIETGCKVFKFIGGCTNPNSWDFKKIKESFDGEIIKNSPCIPKDIDENKIDTEGNCPFYNVCTSQMCKYEHKKDTWIEKELKGGLDERTHERYITAIKLFQIMGYINVDSNEIELDEKAKHIKILINLHVSDITSTKFTGSEIDEICDFIIMLKSEPVFKKFCDKLELNFEDEKNKLEIREKPKKEKKEK